MIKCITDLTENPLARSFLQANFTLITSDFLNDVQYFSKHKPLNNMFDTYYRGFQSHN